MTPEQARGERAGQVAALRGLLARFTDPATVERMLAVMDAHPTPAGAPRVYQARQTVRALEVRRGDHVLVYPNRPDAYRGGRYAEAYAMRRAVVAHERIGLAALTGELVEVPALERAP